MSLILEALRKSEERRKLGEAPTLISESAWSSRRRHPLARSDSRIGWMVGALLLAGLAGGAWWWWSRASVPATPPESARTTRVAPAAPPAQPTPAAPVAAAPVPVATPAPAAVATPMPTPPAATQAQLAATDLRIKEELQVSRGAAPVAPTMPEPEPQPVAAATPEPVATPAAAVAATQPQPIATPAPAPAATAPPAAVELPALPEIWQLPLPTRQALPALALTMHVYSADPAQRFALINDKRVGENSPLDNGLDVREIRPDGVVLEFRGERFLLPRGGR